MPSRSLSIFCGQCKELVLRYRKEGSGALIRVYLKQVLEPEYFKQYHNTKLKSGIPPLDCPQCQQRVGIPMIHESGSRPAYRMIKGSFFKKES
jgi:hypothetical protein